jgi:carboxyl-terminal processing protease
MNNFKILLINSMLFLCLLNNSCLNLYYIFSRDEYGRYVNPRTDKEIISDSGIGVEIGIKKDKNNGNETNNLIIITTFANYPAYKAGLLAGDIILEIDGTSTKDMTQQKAINLIQGFRFTNVTLKICRSSSSKILEFSIERDYINPKTVK